MGVENKFKLPDFIEKSLARLSDRRFRTLESEYNATAMLLQREQAKTKQLTEDIGTYNDQWGGLISGDYNPESIGMPEYKKMYDYDAQVIAGFDLIQMGVLMKPWRIRHSDPEVRNTLTLALQRLRYPSFREGMKAMLQAVLYGFSVTELVYADFKGFWMPRQVNGLKTLDPETITFFSDDFGNIRKITQLWRGNPVELPVYRSVIWSHEKFYGNWYGRSILRGVYKHWYIKDAMMKFANIANERFGSPIMKGIVQNKAEEQKMMDALGKTYARSQIVLTKKGPDDQTDVEILESKRSEAPFDKYIRYQDEMILRRMLISNRVFEGGGGTYGPKVPMDLVLMRFEDFRLELIDVVNTMLQMIADLNWASLEEYPVIEFAPLSSMDKAQLQKAIYDAIDKEILDKDEPWIRNELGFRELDPSDMPEKQEDEQ